MQINLQIIAASQNIRSQKALRPRLCQSTVKRARPFRKFAPNINVREVYVVRVTGDDHPLDELVRVFMNDLPILERSWLGLIRITD